MYVELCMNNGIRYLRLVSSRRVTDARGNKVARKKVELNIGPLSRYDDGEPNYVERLKQSFKEGAPIISALEPFVSNEAQPMRHVLTFEDGSDACIGHPKAFSQALLERIYTELGLSAFFASLKHEKQIAYDLSGFVRLLVFGRILDPASKYATTQQNEEYFSVLCFMDAIA